MIQVAGDACSTVKMCDVLEVSRSAYYQWLQDKQNGHLSAHIRRDQELSRLLLQLHCECPSYGLDTLHAQLRKKQPVGRKRIGRLMRALDICSNRKRAYKGTTNSRHSHPIAPNLLQRRFTIPAPNLGWVGDITYIPTDEGFAYTAIVKDLFHHKVVGYATSSRIDSHLVVDALSMALRREKPGKGLIFHSDRGVQYASQAFRDTLKSAGIRQSMSRKGDPYDNAVSESFFSAMKCEMVHQMHFQTRAQAKHAVFSYIEGFYNTRRIQRSLGWKTPCEFERANRRAA